MLLAMAALAGCGVGQSVREGAVEAAKWAFTTRVETMNIDLVARAALNADGAGQPLSTVVRIYQLKSPQAFESLSYAQLLGEDLDSLGSDLLATHDVVLRPAAAASVSEPMKPDADYVGVAALFRDTGKNAVWKVVIPKKQWKATDPVKIIARDNVLEVVSAEPAS